MIEKKSLSAPPRVKAVGLVVILIGEIVRNIDDCCLVFEDIKGNLSFIESRSIICVSNVDREGLSISCTRVVGDSNGDLV